MPVVPVGAQRPQQREVRRLVRVVQVGELVQGPVRFRGRILFAALRRGQPKRPEIEAAERHHGDVYIDDDGRLAINKVAREERQHHFPHGSAQEHDRSNAVGHANVALQPRERGRQHRRHSDPEDSDSRPEEGVHPVGSDNEKHGREKADAEVAQEHRSAGNLNGRHDGDPPRRCKAAPEDVGEEVTARQGGTRGLRSGVDLEEFADSRFHSHVEEEEEGAEEHKAPLARRTLHLHVFLLTRAGLARVGAQEREEHGGHDEEVGSEDRIDELELAQPVLLELVQDPGSQAGCRLVGACLGCFLECSVWIRGEIVDFGDVQGDVVRRSLRTTC